MSVLKRYITFYFVVFFLLFLGCQQAHTNVWDSLRQGFKLNHATSQPEVQTQIRWLMNHPNHIYGIAKKAEPYIYHILQEVKARHLPTELALMPMVESAYDPFVYSSAGAAGLWQIMPQTAKLLGLRQDWWFDGRRSVKLSTNAALKYLSYLNHRFNGDWLMAIAAYDAGEGTISKSIKAGTRWRGRPEFWQLTVPTETRIYVPRLLALAEVMSNPARYGTRLPDIPDTPYFEEVNIGSQIDLSHAAKMAGMSYQELLKLNPGHNRTATAPNQPYKLLLPRNKVACFKAKLANLSNEQRVSWQQHLVKKGETLASIAGMYHTTKALIMQLNKMKNESIRLGQLILIPHNRMPATLPATIRTKAPVLSTSNKMQKLRTLHIVQTGESLNMIAQKYHCSPNEIRSWNRMAADSALKKDQQLIIWRSA